MICRCYPFFMGEKDVEVMRCGGLGNKMAKKEALEMAQMVKRYEIKKLRSYIRIIEQLEENLSLAKLGMVPRNYSGEVVVFDGETRSRVVLRA